ncbi:MAG: PAS domain S-box protein [Bacteroidetes bacterium]|nr:PAS domain S-box protein [Bacteroidota bacterium]
MTVFKCQPEWKIPFVYFFVSAVWILFSDVLLFEYLEPVLSVQTVSMLKGWFFVILTAMLLHLLLRRYFRAQREKLREREEILAMLRMSEERYRMLSEDLPAMICEFLPDSTLTYVNRAYSEYFDMNPGELVGRKFLEFLPEEAARRVQKTYMSLTPGRPCFTYSHTVIVRDRMVDHEWTDRAFFDEQGTPVRFQAVGFDITERRRAENALRESEERYRALIERANDGILLLRDGIFISCNQSAAAMLGLDPADIIGRRPQDFSPQRQPDGSLSADRAPQLMQESVAGAPLGFEWIHLRRDGTEAVIDVSLSRVEIRDEPVLLCFWRDITQRKQVQRQIAESRRRLRALAERLDRVREEERMHLSREIHDGLGQSLTAIKIDLSLLRRLCEQQQHCDQDLHDAITSMEDILRQTIEQVRQIAWHMRPGMLDQLGLSDALRQYVRDIVERSDLTLVEDIQDIHPPLDARTALALYRIVQEAATNTIRHAHARILHVRLKQADTHVTLEIRDDGDGIQPGAEKRSGGIGLISMRERAELLGGSLTLQTGPDGKGTRVCVTVPVCCGVNTRAMF